MINNILTLITLEINFGPRAFEGGGWPTLGLGSGAPRLHIFFTQNNNRYVQYLRRIKK